ncbi:ventral expressed homeobox [Scomber scombrus]|uniref:Ventral expressed homeobox n=1 Tax=Scomber scombrus TaxID=13677 RepID=A0AAV1NSW2_SCOSC
MANFSVEWLSQSYYATQKSTEDLTPKKDAALYSEVQSETVEFTKESKSQYFPISPNNSCGYTSWSESEVGEDSEGEATQQRRMRTMFTSEQISKLENTFNKHKYLGATQRRKLAEKLNLSETQVKTWFQNRRMKMKREVQDMRPEYLSVPAALLPPVLFQHPIFSGQLPGRSAAFYPRLQQLHRTSLPPPLHQHRTHPVILPPPFY